MSRHLYYSRSGEEARMLARCQFGLNEDGSCGVEMTYPIQGYPWRRNPVRQHEFSVPPEKAALLIEEIFQISECFPDECLDNDQLWSDSTETANGVTRELGSDVACITLGVYLMGEALVYYSMREDSPTLLQSLVHRTVTGLIAPYERLDG